MGGRAGLTLLMVKRIAVARQHKFLLIENYQLVEAEKYLAIGVFQRVKLSHLPSQFKDYPAEVQVVLSGQKNARGRPTGE